MSDELIGFVCGFGVIAALVFAAAAKEARNGDDKNLAVVMTVISVISFISSVSTLTYVVMY